MRSATRIKSNPSLSRNAAFNVGGLVIYLAIAFFLSPYIIRHLGNARYGAWALASELMGYYTLLDFGIRAAVGFFVARYSAREEHDRLEASICSAFWGLAGIGLVLCILGIGSAFLFPHLFTKGDVPADEVVPAMVILATTIGLGFPMEIFGFVLSGCRRQDLLNITEVVSRVLVAAGMYAVLRSGGGLIGISAIQCGGRILCWVWNYWLAQLLAGPFSLRPSRFRKTELRAIVGLGSMNIVISLAQLVMSRSDLIVIGVFLGVKDVAYYNIGRLLVEYVTQFNISVTRAFTPHLTHLYAREELAATRRLFLIGTRFSGLLSFPLAACLFVFGHAFLRLWIGPGYVTGPLGQRSDIVMAVLLLTYMPQWQQSISRQLLLASGKYRFLMYQQVVQAVANVVLSLLLIRWYGVIGVAAAKVVPGAVSDLVVIPVHVLRRLNIPLRQYVREGVARALLVGVALFAFTWPLVRLWNPAFSWKVLFLQVGVSLLVYGILGWTIGLTAQDRQLARERLASVLGRLRPVPRRESLQP